MTFDNLNGAPIVRARLVLPAVGIWHADVVLSTPAALPGPQVLTIGGSVWRGAIIRSTTFTGLPMVRIVGGTGGWRKTVPARQYASPVGVPTVHVLTDLALLVGEAPPVLSPPVPPVIAGHGFVRRAGPAMLTLNAVLGAQWWVDPLGVVQTISRPPKPIRSSFQVEGVDGAEGVYHVTTETPGDWLPGALFASPTAQGTISRVSHIIRDGSLRTEVMAA